MTLFYGHLVSYLVFASFVGLGFTLLIVTDVISIRLIHRIKSFRMNRFVSKWTSSNTLPRPRGKSIQWLVLWASLGRSGDNETRTRLISLGKEHGLIELALKHLRGRSPQNKLIALSAIGFLGDESLRSLVIPLAYTSNLMYSLRCLDTLFHLDSSQAVPFILEQYPKRLDWPRTYIQDLLCTLSPVLLSEYIQEALRKTPSHSIHRLIPFLRLMPSKDRTAQLMKYSSPTASTETLVACLKIVSLPKEMHLARERLSHNNWQVRCAAAGALGRGGNVLDKPLLDPLLCDPVWWVRQSVLHAIFSLPDVKQKDLREIQLIHADLFVLETVR